MCYVRVRYFLEGTRRDTVRDTTCLHIRGCSRNGYSLKLKSKCSESFLNTIFFIIWKPECMHVCKKFFQHSNIFPCLHTDHSLIPSARRQIIAPPLPVNLALSPKLPASSTMLMLRVPTTASPATTTHTYISSNKYPSAFIQ